MACEAECYSKTPSSPNQIKSCRQQCSAMSEPQRKKNEAAFKDLTEERTKPEPKEVEKKVPETNGAEDLSNIKTIKLTVVIAAFLYMI